MRVADQIQSKSNYENIHRFLREMLQKVFGYLLILRDKSHATFLFVNALYWTPHANLGSFSSLTGFHCCLRCLQIQDGDALFSAADMRTGSRHSCARKRSTWLCHLVVCHSPFLAHSIVCRTRTHIYNKTSKRNKLNNPLSLNIIKSKT